MGTRAAWTLFSACWALKRDTFWMAAPAVPFLNGVQVVRDSGGKALRGRDDSTEL
jgi:hypothetical protein